MKTLLIDLLPYEHSTRTRKVGALLARQGHDALAITLARVGRVGIRSAHGTSGNVDGVAVRYIAVAEPAEGATIMTTVRNLLTVYPVPIIRMLRASLQTPADTIFVGHMALFWIGLAHRRKFGSRVVLNGRERPGGIRTRGSLGTVFSRIEPHALRVVGRSNGVATLAVCDSHAEAFVALGMKNVLVARNVPEASFHRPFVPLPALDTLVIVCVGSLYPGRGLEPLIDAVAQCRSEGLSLRLDLVGFASSSYRDALQRRMRESMGEEGWTLRGPCPPDEVPEAYHRAHVATALYEPVDTANDSLSNKIFEGVASGRPVLAGALPENQKLVRGAELGWTSEVDAESLACTLRRIWASKSELPAMALHAHDHGRRAFVWDREAAPLVAWMKAST